MQWSSHPKYTWMKPAYSFQVIFHTFKLRCFRVVRCLDHFKIHISIFFENFMEEGKDLHSHFEPAV